jgi:hypothetical protein
MNDDSLGGRIGEKVGVPVKETVSVFVEGDEAAYEGV